MDFEAFKHIFPQFCWYFCSFFPPTKWEKSSSFPLNLLFVTLTVLHPICSMWAKASRVWGLFCRQRNPGVVQLVSKVTVQQQQHQHFAKLCTPRGKMELSWRVCCSHPLRLTQTICACQRPVFPSSHRDNPEAFLWVYEGLAVACGRLKEEAGREQTSSDCGPGTTLLH